LEASRARATFGRTRDHECASPFQTQGTPVSSLPKTSNYIAQNTLLASLDEGACHRLLARASPVELSAGDLLYDACIPLERMYFPATSVVSLQYDLAGGSSAELAAVGDEGLVASALFDAGPTTPSRAVVMSAGWAYVVSGDPVAAQLGVGCSIPVQLSSYTHVLLGQMAQAALCNADHTEEQRLSRWLLMRFDRNGSDELDVTQQALAHAVWLGFASALFVLAKLRRAGVVHFGRDHLSLRDREALNEHSCSCYQAIKRLGSLSF